MNDLQQQIKVLIIDSLGLEDITPADIDSEALELGLAIQKAFGFQMENDSNALREHFRSVATLAAFVAAQQAA